MLRRKAGRALLLAAALAPLLITPAPVAAHPFGPPLTARLEAEGSTVKVTWSAAEDDWLNLGEHVGAFDAAGERDVTGAELLGRSAEVQRYLLEHVAVAQRDVPCAGELAPLDDPLGTGAELTFTCGAPVTGVDVTLSVLTDVNPAYRTVAAAPGGGSPRQTLFTSAVPTRHLTFDTSASGVPSRRPVLAITLAGALAVALAAAAVHLVRSRPSRRSHR